METVLSVVVLLESRVVGEVVLVVVVSMCRRKAVAGK